jgi:hypothetical protein
VEVAACRALHGRGSYDRVVDAEVARLVDRDHDPVDPVNRAFVVDESARPELADGYEAGPVQVLVCPPAPPGRDPCRQRQAREVEAGQEPLRRYPADHDRVAMEQLHEAGTLLAALGVRGGGRRGRATNAAGAARHGRKPLRDPSAHVTRQGVELQNQTSTPAMFWYSKATTDLRRRGLTPHTGRDSLGFALFMARDT